MPMINGCKYSCEPCIRGHRATSCMHNDRLLLEVRKPGRPLESCGHEFSTCTCGKLTELITAGQVIPNNALGNQGGQNLILVCPPNRARSSKAPRPKTQRRASKTQERKARQAPRAREASENTPKGSLKYSNGVTTQTIFDPVRHASIALQQGSSNLPGIADALNFSGEAITQTVFVPETLDHFQSDQGPSYQQSQQNFPAYSGSTVTASQSQPYPAPSCSKYSCRVEDLCISPQNHTHAGWGGNTSLKTQSHYQ